MLLITRRTSEGIIINGAISVKILEIKGGRVKLGLEYPQGNSVYRAEVFEKIKAENQAAVGLDAAALGKVLQLGTSHAKSQTEPQQERSVDANPSPERTK